MAPCLLLASSAKPKVPVSNKFKLCVVVIFKRICTEVKCSESRTARQYEEKSSKKAGVADMEPESTAELEEEEEEVPTRVETSKVSLPVRAHVARFDFEGLVDGGSMATILTHVAPRHLVIAAGSPEAGRLLFANKQ